MRKAQARSAFSLVEVTIALGVAVFCLLAVVGLLQTGATNDQSTLARTAAWGMLSGVIADVNATAPTNATSPFFKVALTGQSLATPQTLYFSETGEPTGPIGSAPNAQSRYRVSIGIQSPAANSSAPATARLLASWPAQADPLPNEWPSKAVGTVEVITAFSRN